MRILIVGAGPAGLYFGYLMRRQRPDADIRIVEQNARGAAPGFGLVFSEQALAFLRADDPETHDLITPAMETWRDMTIVHRGERVCIDGIGFAGIGRLRLLELLGQRLESAGLAPEYGRTVRDEADLAGFDLVVGADGVNSQVRALRAAAFGATVGALGNKFAWCGTRRRFDTLTQTFVQTEYGPMNAHHYSYAKDMSTFLVECAPRSWANAGFADMDEAAMLARCAEIFAETLNGEPLVSNRSIWRNFPVIRNARWSAGNAVLVGDAQRTAHYSIGSGTRLAMEDVIALARAFAEHGDDVPAALAAFEADRRPVVEKLVTAADASADWYERFPEHMRLAPHELAMSYIQRSGRITDERLAKLSPRFLAAYEAARRAPGD
jgi:2-polyprenyl-6-methoxyphenol hydroxylase-like FAD-dependent oxidoreductase